MSASSLIKHSLLTNTGDANMMDDADSHEQKSIPK